MQSIQIAPLSVGYAKYDAKNTPVVLPPEVCTELKLSQGKKKIIGNQVIMALGKLAGSADSLLRKGIPVVS